MRLLSLTVRNYRAHQNTTVTFDPSRTVIGGANEFGKSTLVEAAHHALFLRAKTGGEIQKSMLSHRNPTIPEVELSFEAGEESYHLHKRFGGSTKGSATLRNTLGGSWQGDDAEAKLSELLRVESTGKPRDAAQQWAHLWIRQGESGIDPSSHASSQKESLIARLQTQGTAAVMQSDLDSELATRFEEESAHTYGKNEKVRSTSELGRAHQARHEALAHLQSAEATAIRLDQAVREFHHAGASLIDANRNLPGLEQQLKETQARLETVKELRHKEQAQRLASETAAQKYTDVLKADAEIRELAEQAASARTHLAPKQEQLTQLRQSATQANEQLAQADQSVHSTGQAVREARLQCDLARLYASRFELQELRDSMRDQSAKIASLRTQLAPLEEQLTALPAIDSRRLTKLQQLDSQYASAKAALAAMSSGIELLQGDVPVSIDGEPLAPHSPRILTEPTAVVIGSEVRLRILPGGGNRLAEARAQARDSEQAFQQALDASGVASLDVARHVHEQRQSLDKQIERLRAGIEAMNVEAIQKKLAQTEAELHSANAEIARRQETLPDLVAPTQADEARALREQSTSRLAEAEASEAKIKASRQSYWESQERIRTELERLLEAFRSAEAEVQQLNTRHGVLVETHGDEAKRAAQLTAAQQAKIQSEEVWKLTRRELEQLQPEQLETDRLRLERSVQNLQRQKSEAEQSLAAAKAVLAHDGSSDPEAARALAVARAESAGEHFAAVERKAKAVQLLARMFHEQQGKLAETFTAPLADKITGYLRALFGPHASALVELAGNEFSGLRLVRADHGAFGFEALSGGAKEQMAAAVRLAMAEVLAADHSGCLPLVFDDAFAYSDPERVQTLQRMLDLAASRGLQIIVLTCTPADYAGLGAHVLRLQEPPRFATLSSPHSSTAEALATDLTTPDEPIEVDEDAADRFLHALHECGGSSGNNTLRQLLGWDESGYDAVKAFLVDQGKVTPGRGRGGSVSLNVP